MLGTVGLSMSGCGLGNGVGGLVARAGGTVWLSMHGRAGRARSGVG
jgi:hypothetical protein